MAFLSQVKVKGRRYIYLTEYVGKKKYGKYTERNVYGFGEKNKAFETMRQWQNDFSTFPEHLLKLGYGEKDLEDWIRTLETGISKTGRSKKFV